MSSDLLQGLRHYGQDSRRHRMSQYLTLMLFIQWIIEIDCYVSLPGSERMFLIQRVHNNMGLCASNAAVCVGRSETPNGFYRWLRLINPIIKRDKRDKQEWRKHGLKA